MPARSDEEFRSLLIARATELTGLPAGKLVDEDGDVQLVDRPFWIWARITTRQGDPQKFLVLVALPLMDVNLAPELTDLLAGYLAGKSVDFEIEGRTIQLFRPLPTTVLDVPEDFRAAFLSMLSVGKSVVAGVQPRMGGVTPEQARALVGWRGVDDQVEADIREALGGTGGELLAHGWNPRKESLPVLISSGAAEDGFVTLDDEGAVRLRSRVPGRREGARGLSVTIRKLAPDAAWTWAERLGVERRVGALQLPEIMSVTGRPWQELMEATSGLPRQSGDAWVTI